MGQATSEDKYGNQVYLHPNMCGRKCFGMFLCYGFFIFKNVFVFIIHIGVGTLMSCTDSHFPIITSAITVCVCCSCCCWRFFFFSLSLSSCTCVCLHILWFWFSFLGFYSLSRIWKVFVQSSFVLSHQYLGPHKYVWEGLKTKRKTNEKNQIESKWERKKKTTRPDDIQYLFLTVVYIVSVECSGTKIGDEWNWITHSHTHKTDDRSPEYLSFVWHCILCHWSSQYWLANWYIPSVRIPDNHAHNGLLL